MNDVTPYIDVRSETPHPYTLLQKRKPPFPIDEVARFETESPLLPSRRSFFPGVGASGWCSRLSRARFLPGVVETRRVFRARLNKAFLSKGALPSKKQIMFRVCTKYLGFGFLNFLFFFVFFFAPLRFSSTSFLPLDAFFCPPRRTRWREKTSTLPGRRRRRRGREEEKPTTVFFSSSFSSFDVRSLDALGSF